MIRSRVRSALLGSAVGVGLIAASGTANAIEYNFGDVQVFLDTTVSAGVQMRVAERNMNFVAAGNGGPVANPILLTTNNATTNLSAANPVVTAGAVAANNQRVTHAPNGSVSPVFATNTDSYAGSINSDDSRMNFDRWDLTSGNVKMTNDIQANWQNYTLFARVSSFYDAVLGDGSSYERSKLRKEGYPDAVRDIDLLDFYVSGDFNVGDLPLNVRVGKQVVNWGEATFLLNGISSWNPFDVNAFRRPGAEIKEGLLPVWGAYASLGLPYDLSLEAFYQLDFEPLQLDRPGTPFAGSDVARVGSGTGGNERGTSWLTGGRSGGGFLNRNCSTPDPLSLAFDARYAAAGETNFVCGAGGTNPFIDYATDLPIGQSEFYRLLLRGGQGDVFRLNDDEADDQGQYGVALRWYAEELNSTEFGFYFMNYHSRLPLVSERLTLSSAAGASQVRSYLAVEDEGSTTGRGTNLGGCFNPGALNPALGALPANTPGAILAFLDPAKLAYMNSVQVQDSLGLAAAAEAAVNGGGSTHASATALGLNAAAPVLNPANAGLVVQDGSLLELQLTNCLLAGAQSAGGLMVDGTELLVPTTPNGQQSSLGLFLEYPEDIKLYGVSFNTTVGDWGVQGEVAFRQDQPFQLDTDQLTIAALGASCILDSILGADAMSALQGFQTYQGGVNRCSQAGQDSVSNLHGFVREEVLTFDIGTTATYTNSNQFVGALGADIGILLTEVGGMWVPDVPEDVGGIAGTSQNPGFSRWGNVCTSGSDLPLGGFLALSPRSGCRPTEFSYGYVLVGILQYNNAFGTPITLSPRVAWSHDVKGNSPAPLSNYREGTKQISLAVDASYQNSWRGGISYTNIFGNEKYTKDGDKDFISINVSYSF
ncbi:MAG: DUF1302 domain-containing protein [Alphaproteobacteria bacterium]|nr:DUF1302 domain-containing protein [Alphaproteobacteria bacterium]MBO6627054.1 DUF1302 domain-containing protein [Alphaproteobacteria bacterium]